MLERLDDLRQQPIAGSENGIFPMFSPDGRSLGFFAEGQLKKMPAEGGTATPLASSLGTISGASWGTEGIVVSSNGRLVMVPRGGGAPAPIRRNDATVGYWPVVLAGGKAVIYATTGITRARLAVAELSSGRIDTLSLTGQAPVGMAGEELIVVRNDGALVAVPFNTRTLRVAGSERVVVQEVAQGVIGTPKVTLSPNGSLAYVPGSTVVQMVAVDLHGATRPLAVPAGRLNNPRYSPDGRRIATDLSASGRQDIWIYDAASGAAQRVTSEGTQNQRAEWNADGTRLVFRSDRAGGRQTLWWQPADGSGVPQELLSVAEKNVSEGVLTPDGKTVVFRTGTYGGADLWYRHLAGDTAVKAIAATPFDEVAPRVSPDGRWIAYQSNESGASQVVVRPLPGPGAQVTVSVGGGTTPMWSRDGRRLFYFNGTKFIAASVSTTPTFVVTAREVLFEGNYPPLGGGHATFDVAPDGKSFLMLKPAAGSNEEIVVIHNWLSELRASEKREERI